MGANIDFNLTGNLVPPLEDDQDTVINFNLPRKIYNVTAGRAVADLATTVESEACTYETMLNIDRTRLLNEASLLLLPNTYKEGKLYSHKPLNGNGDFTATRATTATRVNAAGLVDLVPYNLLSYSEQFDNLSYWSKVRFSATANTTTAPDGTLTADTISMTQVGSLFRVITQVVSGTTLTYTASVYFKYIDRQYIQFTFDGTFGGSQRVNIDLLNGVITADSMNGGSTLISVGNGWYKLTATSTGTNTQPNFVIWAIDTDTASRAVLSTGTGSTFIWGAQVVEGTSARDYLRTETRLNIPRLDYSLGGCPNILLEPQRTNLVLQSSSFDNAVWSRTTSTVTPNQRIAPDGTLTMDLLTFVSAGTFTTQGISVTSGATYTFSVWLATQSGTQTVEIGNINLGAWQSFTVTTTPQRFEVTQVASASSRFPGIRCTAAYSIFAWGAQVEAGAYATSFIPTTTASVTRNADSITRNNIFTNGLITAAGGTWFVELRNNVARVRDGLPTGLGLGDTSALGSNAFVFRQGSLSSRMTLTKWVAGVLSTLFVTTNDTAKIAIKWNGTTADVFENGIKVVSSTAFNTTNLEFLSLINLQVPAYINEMALFPTPLSDTELISMTTI